MSVFRKLSRTALPKDPVPPVINKVLLLKISSPTPNYPLSY